jgi:hypothetical protein
VRAILLPRSFTKGLLMSTIHTGTCHCGAVRYTAELDLTQPVVACNCSMCGRAGWLLSFIPASKFHLEAGADSLTDYQFARRHIHHTFCKVCGVRPFSRGATPDGGEMIAVNVRCLADVDPTQLEIKPFDGKSL